MLSLAIRIERFPLAHTFTSARGTDSEAIVVVAEVTDGSHRGRGECNPRFGNGPDAVTSAIMAMAGALAQGMDRNGLQSAMPAGAARNALDCALWDLEAKRSGVPCYRLAGLQKPAPVVTAYSIPLDTPQKMADAARAVATRPLLKVKLGGRGDPDRIRAVRSVAPNAELIVDANQAWNRDTFAENLAACAAAGVTLVEQPLPVSDDSALLARPHPMMICADESVRDSGSLSRLVGRYDAVNIKLDKAGGLTEGLKMADRAAAEGLSLMVGCTLGTSLAIAPAILLAQRARLADLDGPLFLAADRRHGLKYDHSIVRPPEPELWG